MNELIEQKNSGLNCFPADKIQLLKNTVCKGASNAELELFMHVCQRTGLDPFMRQIYSIERRNKDENGNWNKNRVIQVSIDGFRIVAERTGKYSPGPEPTFVYNEKNALHSATAYVKKLTPDGTWHIVSATAFWAEYAPSGKNHFWDKMPHGQLAKCAESLALRKSFPGEFCNIYSHEEMEQADVVIQEVKPRQVPAEFVEETIQHFLSHFEEKELMLEYLEKYCAHWKKSLCDGIEDYTSNHEKFKADFAKWKKQHYEDKQ